MRRTHLVLAMTLGALGCSSRAVLKAERQRQVFIAVNFRDLSRELAAGRGEFAASFAGLLGCRKDAVPSFLSFSRRHYTRLIPSPDAAPVEILRNFEDAVASDAVLSRACSL